MRAWQISALKPGAFPRIPVAINAARLGSRTRMGVVLTGPCLRSYSCMSRASGSRAGFGLLGLSIGVLPEYRGVVAPWLGVRSSVACCPMIRLGCLDAVGMPRPFPA